MSIRNSTKKRITLTRSLNGLSFGRQFIWPPHAHANYEHVNEVSLTMEALWIRLRFSVLSFFVRVGVGRRWPDFVFKFFQVTFVSAFALSYLRIVRAYTRGQSTERRYTLELGRVWG